MLRDKMLAVIADVNAQVAEREELVENVYDIIVSSNAKTIDDIDKAKIKSFLSMHRTFREMGLKKQTQLMLSLSKVLFNSDILVKPIKINV